LSELVAIVNQPQEKSEPREEKAKMKICFDKRTNSQILGRIEYDTITNSYIKLNNKGGLL